MRVQRQRQPQSFSAPDGEATAAGPDVAAGAVSGSTLPAVVRQQGIRSRRPRPRLLLSGAAGRGVPWPPRRVLQPRRLRVLSPFPIWELQSRSRSLSANAIRQDRPRPLARHNGRLQAPPDRARGSSLSLRPGLKCRHWAAAGWLLHAEMSACQGGGKVVFRVVVRASIRAQTMGRGSA